MRDERAFHSLVEPDRPRDAAASGALESNIGPAQNVGDARVGCAGGGNAGEGADLDDAIVEHERLADAAQDSFGDLLRSVGGGGAERESDRELVAAQASDNGLFPQLVAKRCCERTKDPLAGFVTMPPKA